MSIENREFVMLMHRTVLSIRLVLALRRQRGDDHLRNQAMRNTDDMLLQIGDARLTRMDELLRLLRNKHASMQESLLEFDRAHTGSYMNDIPHV
eukprot:gene13030-biopygen3928